MIRLLTNHRPPKTKKITADLYITLEPYTFSYEVDSKVITHNIPKGFILDYFSSKVVYTPLSSYLFYLNYFYRFIIFIYNILSKVFLGARGVYDAAALEHDYLYHLQEKRLLSDQLFHLRCAQNSRFIFIADFYYYTLRIFGHSAYRDNRVLKNTRVVTKNNYMTIFYQGVKIKITPKILKALKYNNPF